MNRPALWKSLIIIFVLFFSVNTRAQDYSAKSRTSGAENIFENELESRRSDVFSGRNPSRPRIRKMSAKDKKFLAPPAEDSAAFASFLKKSGTGLIRLLPRFKYTGRVSVREAGAYYSFALLTHEYGYGSDIGLELNKFKVGFAGTDYGYISKLGDISLDQVALDHPAVKSLAAFVTSSKEPEARIEQRKSNFGIWIGEYYYKNYIPAEADTTYILRSINYGLSDVLIAFRTIRQDADGSFIILWKRLKKFPTPQLKQP